MASESENSQVTWDTIRAFNFEKVKEGKKVPKVADESKWKGGKVDIKVIPDSKDSNNKILELNVKKFGQLRFGNFSLPEKRDYRAIIDLWGQEGQEVVVQLRFLTKPYKVLAKEKVSLTNEPQKVVLNLPDFYIDRKVALFLITKQSSKIYVDNVAIQARALTKQELEEKQKIEALRKERKAKNQVIANQKMEKAWEAGNIAFPDDANLVNVVTYGAKGDGVTDDTAAIQDAFNNNAASHKIIYFPNGEYLISDTLKWTRRTKGKDYKTTIFQGE
ncbi:MAG: glycosyl hydrolase family 28-related protein, partial [Chlamydiota bacterium]